MALHRRDSLGPTLLHSARDPEGSLIFRKNTDISSIPRREMARVGRGRGDVAAEEWRCLHLGCQATEVCSIVSQEHSTQIPTVQGIGLGQLCGWKQKVARFGLYEMTCVIARDAQCCPTRQSTFLSYSWPSPGHHNMVEKTPQLENFRPLSYLSMVYECIRGWKQLFPGVIF